MSAQEKSVSEIEKIRHSLAHILAMAVLERWPSAKLGVGPTIMNGFYYDFELPEPVSPEDLSDIESRMRRIVKQNLGFRGRAVSFEEAREFFQKKNQPYKLNLIHDLEAYGTTEVHEHEEMKKGEKERKRLSTVTLYQTGNFVDLCRGGHVESTAEIDPEAFRLSRVAGAYWRGSEQNPMLTRIYGIAFHTKTELNEYLRKQEEAAKRDHRRLGKELDLFMFHETAPGMPYWLPKGLIVLNELVKFWREEHEKRGYQEIKSPLLNKKELYETSGHWEHFREHMFLSQPAEGEIYGLKPMNCPNAMIVFGGRPRSYRELPLRLSDTDTLHRYELAGTLAGLLRVREFSQDDAHIFLREDQIKDEYAEVLKIAKRFYSIFDIDYSFRLGTRPQKFMGDPKVWDRAEKELQEILEESGRPYFVLKGDGAFYGPKIDILVEDSLDREWQTGTIQLDFQIPLRFGLTYTDKNGEKKTPAVVHRVIYGSLERFIGILLEHYAGVLPVWLSPVQAVVVPVGSSFNAWARVVGKKVTEAGIRAEVWLGNETVSKKIRDAELQKIPYALVVGAKEKKAKSVRVRERKRGDIGMMKVERFVKRIAEEIQKKK